MIKNIMRNIDSGTIFFLENDGENTPDINTYMYIFVQ